MLFGSGSTDEVFLGYPYYKWPKYLDLYILGTMGYHVEDLLDHLFGERKNDFVEMLLHHICAVFLYGFCYMTNLVTAGAVIMYLHDWADMSVSFCKILTNTNYDTVTAVIFIHGVGWWFYTRIYVLP